MVFDQIEDWIRETLSNSIISILSGMFEHVNDQVGDITTQVGTTPQGWNGSIFSMIQSLSETVILPIAGVILAFIMTLELIRIITERNNMSDVDEAIFFKWIFKTAGAILIVSNTWNIVMAVFDVAQRVVGSAGGLVSGTTAVDITSAAVDIEATLDTLSIGHLLGLWFQAVIVSIATWAVTICIFVVLNGRMIEIYLVTSLAPIPMASMFGRELSGGMGQNYLRSLFALAFQAFLIIVCVAIYAVLVQTISLDDDIGVAMWTSLGYTILLCFTLFKTGSISKAIFSAH